MRGNISTFHKIVAIIMIAALAIGIATLAYFLQKPSEKASVQEIATNSTEEAARPSGTDNNSKSTPNDNNSIGQPNRPEQTVFNRSNLSTGSWSSTTQTSPFNKPNTSTKQTVTPPTAYSYVVKYLDETGKEVHRTTSEGQNGQTVVIKAEDLFSKGYELFDADAKVVKLTTGSNEISFRVGKSREKMPLEEFLKQEVNYAYPLKYRNLDFTNRQKDLEDFVIKKIYQHDKETGIFYGTKDQAEQIRTTMLNASYQGAYFRYVTDIRPMPAKAVKGDNKYQLNIEFVYKEEPENIEAGEAAITAFYEKYKNRVKTDAEKAKFIQDWLMKNVKTRVPATSEPHYPWVYNSSNQRRIHFPASAMLDGEGVCLTYAMTFARLAERFGLDVRVVQGAFIGGDARYEDRLIPQVEAAQEMLSNPDTTTYREQYFNHGWNLVKIDGKWHHVDVYHDLNLAANFKLSDKHQYFLQSDEFVKKLTIEYEMGPSVRKMNVYKAWNTNRIPAAPESQNQAKNLPDLTD